MVSLTGYGAMKEGTGGAGSNECEPFPPQLIERKAAKGEDSEVDRRCFVSMCTIRGVQPRLAYIALISA